jgi:hypothetical protein
MSAGILPTDNVDHKLTTTATRNCSIPRVTLTWPPDANTFAMVAATSEGSAPAMETNFAEDRLPTEDGQISPQPMRESAEGCRTPPRVGRLQHHDSAAHTYHLSSPERTRELYIERGWRNSIQVTDVRSMCKQLLTLHRLLPKHTPVYGCTHTHTHTNPCVHVGAPFVRL